MTRRLTTLVLGLLVVAAPALAVEGDGGEPPPINPTTTTSSSIDPVADDPTTTTVDQTSDDPTSDPTSELGDATTTTVDATPTTTPSTSSTQVDDAKPTSTTSHESTSTTTVTSPTDAHPLVVCAWQVADTDLDLANGVQASHPEGPPMPTDDAPCSGAQPAQVDGAPGISVIANPGDAPTRRGVEVWAVLAAAPTEPVDLHVDLTYPDGSFKARALAEPVACEDLGAIADVATPRADSPLGFAVHTGQLDGTAAAALLHRCESGAGTVVRATFDLSVNEPCGAYAVRSTARTADRDDELLGGLEVGCFHYVDVDATSVDWGELLPGVTGILLGDWSPTSDDAPTVRNLGSSGALVGVRFDPMTGPDGAAVTGFAAAFTRSATAAAVSTDVPAGIELWFAGDDQLLCAGDAGRLDLAAHIPEGLPVGEYSGSLDILVEGAAGPASPCNNDRGWFGGPWDAGSNQRTPAVVVATPPLPAPPTTSTTAPTASSVPGGGESTPRSTAPPTTTTTTPPTTTITPPTGSTLVPTTTSSAPATSSTSSTSTTSLPTVPPSTSPGPTPTLTPPDPTTTTTSTTTTSTTTTSTTTTSTTTPAPTPPIDTPTTSTSTIPAVETGD